VTCLVALRHSRGVVLGADSAAVAGADVTTSRKIFRRGSVWISISGEYEDLGRMLDTMSPRAAPADLPRWLRRHDLPGEGFAWTAASGLIEWGSSVAEVLDYSAAGSGWQYAIGAIHALRAQGSSPVATAVGALRAAAAHRGDVAGPYWVVRLPSGQVTRYR